METALVYVVTPVNNSLAPLLSLVLSVAIPEAILLLPGTSSVVAAVLTLFKPVDNVVKASTEPGKATFELFAI